MRPVSRLLPFIWLLLVVAAGCGAGSATKSIRGDEPRSGGGGDGQVTAKLNVQITNVGGMKDGAGIPVPTGIECTASMPATCSATVTCPVAKGATTTQVGTCRWLAKDGIKLLTQQPPKDEMCTEIYGGPEVATVTGTLEGKPVEAKFTRVNGYEIARFDDVAMLWQS